MVVVALVVNKSNLVVVDNSNLFAVAVAVAVVAVAVAVVVAVVAVVVAVVAVVIDAAAVGFVSEPCARWHGEDG